MVSRILAQPRVLTWRRFIIGLALLAILFPAWLWWSRTRPPGSLVSVATLAGAGPQVTSDSLSDPFGVTVDRAGSAYVSDGLSGRIYRLSESGEAQIVASGLDMPSALAITREGALIVANTGAHTVVRIDPRTGRTGIVAGGIAVSGYSDGSANEARFNGPIGVAVGGDGTIFVADTYNDRIRAIASDGRVRTVAGGREPGFRDGAALEARFDTPCGIVAGRDGSLFIADTGNHRLRRIAADGVVTTLAGTGEPETRDGPLAQAAFNEPTAIAIRRDGALFVADSGSSSLRMITFGEAPSVRTLTGGFPNGLIDGELDSARLNCPTGLAFTPDDVLVFADSASGLVRAVLPRGELRGKQSTSGRVSLPAAEIRAAVPPRWPYNPPEARRELAGTFGEIRGEILSEHEAWFHSGVDLPGAYGETVRAVFTERVTRPLAVEGVGGLRERLRLPLFGYIHVRVGRDENERMLEGLESRGFSLRRDETRQVIGVRVRRGTRINAGDPIGTLNRLNHVHLVAGPPGGEVNALAALTLPGLRDTVPPVIEDVTITNDQDRPFLREEKQGRPLVVISGRARIIVRAYDQVDGNATYRRLGPYRLGYQVLTATGQPSPGFGARRETIVFERLPSDPTAVARVYARGSQSGYEGRTIFAYLITNQMRDGVAREGFWDSSELAPGDYIVRVFVADIFGNETRRDVPVRVVGAQRAARF